MCPNSAETRPPLCPRCDSSDTKPVRERGILKGPFTIRTLRLCGDCGCTFEPPSGRLLSGVVILLGLCSIAGPWPGMIEALSPFDACRVVMESVFVIACFLGGVALIRAGLHAFHGRVSQGIDLDE